MRRALLAGLVITAVGGAGAAVSGVASGQTAAPGAATKTVSYGTFRFQVPSGWPVYDLAHDPGRCVRFDVHAVYLGHPGADQVCPARVRGRTDAVLVEPLERANDAAAPSIHHLSAPDPHMAVPESVARQQQVAIRRADVLMTVTYGDSQAEAQRVVRSGRVAAKAEHTTPAARPAPPASPSAEPSASASASPSESPPADSASPGGPAAAGAHAGRVAKAPPMDLAAQRVRRVPLAAPAPAPRPAPAPAPVAAARPVPTVTVTKTVTVTPRASAPQAPVPQAPSAGHVAEAQAAPHEPPLPRPTISYSEAPKPSHAAESEAKKAKDDAKKTAAKKPDEKKMPALRASRATGKGFDACTAPSLKAMRAWRKSFQAANIYIGGAARACGDGNLSKSWVKSVRKSGWKLIPTYVGLQAPCSSYGSKINTKKAREQGRQSADDAISEAKSFGLSRRAPLYFDMEGYNNTKAWCKKGVLTFLGGWTDRLHQRGYVSGVYGSVSSTIVDLGHASGGRMPDGVWFAHWDGKANTTSSFMSGSWWPDRQRIKQYRGTHNETHGGVRLSIDSNRVDGYVY